MAVYTSKLVASIVGSDATGTPISYTFGPFPGAMDLSIDGLQAGQVEALPVMSNGTFLELVEGDDVPVTFSITMLHDGKLIDASTGKPLNMALKLGTYASGTTKDPGGLVWTVDVVVTLTRSAVTSTITLRNCRLTATYATAKEGNTIALSGTAYGTGSARPATVA
jgi:hypothetical protein